jgi:dihydrofolate reductase
MRKLVYAINISVDGCLDHTKMLSSEELHEFFAQLIRNADLLIYGRITYELMVPFWPDIAKSHSMSEISNDFADAFDAVDKVVFSKSLEKVEDKKSRLVRTDLKEEILRLKQEPGGTILLGGVDLSSQLIALGLVDEYLFVVNPVIAAGGRRLMEGTGLPGGLPLKLIQTTILNSGHVALRYVKHSFPKPTKPLNLT